MAIYINRQAPQSGLASMLAHRGRMGDTELVHMTKPEVQRMMNSGLMSLNPQTGLPEYFLGDLFDFGKRFVKNIIKPKNLIPLVASIALPALAGPLFAGGGALAGLGSFLGPVGTNALLSGTGTFLGNLPFRSVEDSATAGLLSGATQYGLGKASQMMGPSGTTVARMTGDVSDPVMAAHRAKLIPQNTSFVTEGAGGVEFGDFGEATLTDAFGPVQYTPQAGLYMQPVPGAATSAQAQKFLGSMPRTPQPTPQELFGRGFKPENLRPQTPQALTQADIRSALSEAGDKESGFLGMGDFTEDQARDIIRRKAITENKLVTPVGAETKTDMLGITTTPEERLMYRSTNPYQPFYDAGGVKGGLTAAKKFPVGTALKTGLTSADISQSVEDMSKAQEHQERFLKELEKKGVPRPVALQRYQRAMARRQEREGETQEDIVDLYTQGGDRRYFDTATYRPVGTFTAAKGGLISLGHGGRPDFEGMVQGRGHGMEDNVIMDIKEKGGLLAVSPKEYVVPADVMAMIGNGNPDNGAKEMDNFISKFRQKKYGRDRQPPEMDGGRALQSLMKG